MTSMKPHVPQRRGPTQEHYTVRETKVEEIKTAMQKKKFPDTDFFTRLSLKSRKR